MTSESHDGYGQISLEFPIGSDLTAAMVRVNNQLQQVPSYPEAVDEPDDRQRAVHRGHVAALGVQAAHPGGLAAARPA